MIVVCPVMVGMGWCVPVDQDMQTNQHPVLISRDSVMWWCNGDGVVFEHATASMVLVSYPNCEIPGRSGLPSSAPTALRL